MCTPSFTSGTDSIRIAHCNRQLKRIDHVNRLRILTGHASRELLGTTERLCTARALRIANIRRVKVPSRANSFCIRCPSGSCALSCDAADALPVPTCRVLSPEHGRRPTLPRVGDERTRPRESLFFATARAWLRAASLHPVHSAADREKHVSTSKAVEGAVVLYLAIASAPVNSAAITKTP